MNLLRRAFGALLPAAPAARATPPITIGFSMELSGPLAVVGRTGLLAMQIRAQDVNSQFCYPKHFSLIIFELRQSAA